MINLVHFYDSPGGIEVLLPGVIREFSGREFSVFVIRPHSDSLPSVYSDLNVKVTYGHRNNLMAIISIAKYAVKRKAEIFHVFNIGPLFLLILKICGINRLIYSIHGTVYWHNWLEKFLFRIIWRIAIDKDRQVFTSNSKFSREVFRNNIHPGINCELLYNYIDSRRFKREISSVPGKEVRRIIYVGRLASGKGLERWIEIAVDMYKRMPRLFFEIYGEGQLRAVIKQRITDAGANNYIKLKGHRKDIENVYREADLLMFLSEYESFGNVVVESLLCETPVLVNGIPVLREILSDFPDFILSDSPTSAEEVLKRLSGITSLREAAVRAGRTLSERYSIGKHIEKLAGIYDSI